MKEVLIPVIRYQYIETKQSLKGGQCPMKKLYALLMAGIMTVAMVMPVMAGSPNGGSSSGTGSSNSSKPSVSISTVAPETNKFGSEERGAADNGSTIGIAAGNTFANPIANQILANEIVNVTSNAQVLRDLGVSTAAKLKAMIDVSYIGEIPAGGVQIPFDVSGIAKKGDLVYILHRKDSVEGKPWEVVGQGVVGDDASITGTFTSFSPVAFMVVDSTEAPATVVKAPKTGEF